MHVVEHARTLATCEPARPTLPGTILHRLPPGVFNLLSYYDQSKFPDFDTVGSLYMLFMR